VTYCVIVRKISFDFGKLQPIKKAIMEMGTEVIGFIHGEIKKRIMYMSLFNTLNESNKEIGRL
jgi:hypothetical protein